MKLKLLLALIAASVLVALGWGARAAMEFANAKPANTTPVTTVRKGDVTISVEARGELQGGNSEVLTGPMVGGTELIITSLRDQGEMVKAGDTIVEFDTTQQEFNLREAEADLAEAEQQVKKAQAEQQAADLEATLQIERTTGEVEIAELEAKKNSLVSAVTARQNNIALEAARNRLRQAREDADNRKANAGAGVAIQQAALNRSKLLADMAKRNIENMTLKAKTGGYVYVQANSNQNMLYWGQQLPQFQTGDTARPGQAVAQIPDLSTWEVVASIPELDRGHLKPGQQVTIRVAALPGREYSGRVKSLGGTSGSAWDRRFECRIALEKASPELRPGMTSNLTITAETLKNVQWLPSQALFESDGKAFVYLKNAQGFVPRDVKLVRRSESQAVITGLDEGAVVALSTPGEQSKQGDTKQGPLGALPK